MSDGITQEIGETILLVEDDPSVRSVLLASLQRRGYRVVEAGNGAEALEILGGGESVDLMITDVVMPGVSGIELTNLLKEEQPAIVPILISGYFGDDSPHQSTIPEHATLLSKPFMPTDLRSALKSALHRD